MKFFIYNYTCLKENKMIANNYEEASDLFKKTLKVNENAARRELRALKKQASQDREIIECNEKIREIESIIEANKNQFVSEFLEQHKKLFFADQNFMNSFVAETLNSYGVDNSLFYCFEPFFSETNRPTYEEALEFINHSFERSQCYSTMYQTTVELRELIKDFSETNDEVKEYALQKIKSLKNHSDRKNAESQLQKELCSVSDCTKLDLALKSLTETLNASEKAFSDMQNLVDSSKNKTYHSIKVYEGILNSWVKSRQQIFNNLVENSSEYEFIKLLRSNETKQVALKTIFSPDLIDELAKDPGLLINIGAASVTKGKKPADKRVVDYLVKEYTKKDEDIFK